MARTKRLAPAKINLFLDILGRMENGYHELDTVMQAVSLCDILTFEESDALTVRCSDPSLDGKENLAFRAAEAFCAAIGEAPPPIAVTIEKHIPVAAGLAGGSTDAAAVLRELDQRYGHPLSRERLLAVAGGLGADVPFCLCGGIRRAGGIGEKLTACPPLPDCTILLLFSQDRVSTREAYAALDRIARPPHGNRLLSALETGSLDAVGAGMYNIFEVIRPEVRRRKELLIRRGAAAALLSGSGPAVFGLFAEEADARLAQQNFEAEGVRTALCRPLPDLEG